MQSNVASHGFKGYADKQQTGCTYHFYCAWSSIPIFWSGFHFPPFSCLVSCSTGTLFTVVTPLEHMSSMQVHKADWELPAWDKRPPERLEPLKPPNPPGNATLTCKQTRRNNSQQLRPCTTFTLFVCIFTSSLPIQCFSHYFCFPGFDILNLGCDLFCFVRHEWIRHRESFFPSHVQGNKFGEHVSTKSCWWTWICLCFVYKAPFQKNWIA